jgi:catechol 2,3-dioxygenase-like lactoylglutathione lyase family enzyme
VINGLHAILYSSDAEATRAFLRDVLGFAHADAGDGWLIFAVPPAEVAAHPAGEGGRHQLFLMCDDIEATVAELQAKDVELTGPVSDQGWGLVTGIMVPGAGELGLYEPRHPLPPR